MPRGYPERIESQKTSPSAGVQDHFKAVTAASISRGQRHLGVSRDAFRYLNGRLGISTKSGVFLIRFYLDILVKSPYHHAV
jgi:hypothetical protein